MNSEITAPFFGFPLTTVEERRAVVQRLEDWAIDNGGLVGADDPRLEYEHRFLNGMYFRAATIPEKHIITGRIHRTENFFMMLEGEAHILDVIDGRLTMKKGDIIFGGIGAKRAIFAMTRCRICNIFRTDETTVEDAERVLFAESYTIFEGNQP